MGFLIDESMEVPGAPPVDTKKEGIKWGNLRTLQRLQRLLNTMLSAHDKQVIEEFEDLVVRLPAKGYGSTEFDMSDERRDALVNAGRTITRTYLDNLNSGSQSMSGGSIGGTDPQTERANRLADKLAMKLYNQSVDS